MSYRRTIGLALAAVIATCLVGLLATSAVAAPSAAQVSSDRARVDAAVAKLEGAQRRSEAITAKTKQTSAELDRLVADQQQARNRLRSRAVMMYRTGDTGFISVLLGASSFENLASRWDLLTRMNRQDALDLVALKIARAKAEQSAKSLMSLQAQQAQAVDAQASEVASARKDLATSRTALAEYEARAAKVAKAAATADKTGSATPKKTGAAPKSDSTQQLSGSGAWKTSVASHYGKNFRGRGASGESIGPYSMMVAHETLPFGTLIEFEYNGKHAVAHVADRGPYSEGREFDLGPGVIRVLGFNGVHSIRWRVIGR
jgi:rare lipoprotein A (peptidoglycan hydrolase)